MWLAVCSQWYFWHLCGTYTFVVHYSYLRWDGNKAVLKLPWTCNLLTTIQLQRNWYEDIEYPKVFAALVHFLSCSCSTHNCPIFCSSLFIVFSIRACVANKIWYVVSDQYALSLKFSQKQFVGFLSALICLPYAGWTAVLVRSGVSYSL